MKTRQMAVGSQDPFWQNGLAMQVPAPAIPPEKPESAIGLAVKPEPPRPVERGGPAGPEPTRYGDWEKAGRCIDF